MQSWAKHVILTQHLSIIKTKHSKISKYVEAEKPGMQCLEQSNQSKGTIVTYFHKKNTVKEYQKFL